MEQPTTSEEKLLQLIRQDSVKKQKRIEQKKPDLIKAVSAKVEKDIPGGASWLRPINQILMLGCVILAGFIAYKYYQLKGQEIVLPDIKVKNVKVKATAPAVIVSPKSHDYVIGEEDVFESPWTKSQPGTTDTSSGAAVLVQFQQNYKLAGIILDDQPQAIFLDVKTNETFFVNKGEAIAGAVVRDIKEGRVVLNFNGTTFEMNP
ncbi:MAG: hypothetical protein HQL25_00175 [Candidatus Omnitrophica bacterium]|nr:hypothetical protein [Candidatus Omnitrophota bacterium]